MVTIKQEDLQKCVPQMASGHSTGIIETICRRKCCMAMACGSHGITGAHVHQPTRNVNPNNGMITGKPGSKTKIGGVTVPGAKDVKQLYEYLENGKYH